MHSPRLPSARRRHVLAVTLFCATAALSTTAWAQSGPITPSEDQAKLLREGVMAHKLGDFAKAIGIYQEALKIGELNTAYLGLAQSLLKAGRCDEASETLARVLSAPRAIDPPVAQILKNATDLRQQMSTQCPASVTVECTPVDLKVYVDGLGPLPCDGRPLVMLPGEHVLRGELGGKRVEETFKLGLMERAVIRLDLEDELPPVVPVPEAKVIAPEEATPNRPPGVPAPSEETAGLTEEPEAEKRPVRVRKRPPAKPPEAIRRWMLGAHLSGIVSGQADVDRDSFETFDTFSGDETSGLMLEALAGYRISRRYPIFFGAKLNLVPGFELATTESITEETFEPTGTMTDLDLFGMVVFPVGSIELYITVEAGASFLSTPDIDGQTQGGNFGAGAGLRYKFNDKVSLQGGARIQSYALSNDADVFGDETGFEISGSRTMLTVGVAYQP